MSLLARDRIARAQHLLSILLRRTEVLALFPMLVLIAHAVGGTRFVVAAAMVLPTLMVLQNVRVRSHTDRSELQTGPRAGRNEMIAMIDRIRMMPDVEGACFLVEIDDWTSLQSRWGADTATDIRDRCRERLGSVIRGADLLADLQPGRFGLIIHTQPVLRASDRDSIATRLQSSLSSPILIGGSSLRLTACVGHATLSEDSAGPETSTLQAAEAALHAAQSAGPNSTRAHSAALRSVPVDRLGLAPDIGAALETGALRPWFQPQIDAPSGQVIGFEALARWEHPRLGLLGPAHFLGALAEAGKMAAFGTAIRRGALAALAEWDRTGPPGLTVSVNASAEELRNPSFAEHVAWDLDAADLAPDRLIVEVLETVAASSQDDAVMKTLASLREKGILLDLDDFGIGQASLLSIRRFGVRRIKIDRSFVIGVDHDPEQRSMVGVIVSLAREMRLGTLAEGVETEAERKTLIDLGCNALQGFVIGAPMPFDATREWLHSRVGSAPVPALTEPAAQSIP